VYYEGALVGLQLVEDTRNELCFLISKQKAVAITDTPVDLEI